jgi:hypothetical protein
MPSETRYAKRWKRWVGYYLAVSVPLYFGTEVLPRFYWPPDHVGVIHLLGWSLLVAWGFYWIVRNPKSKERSN